MVNNAIVAQWRGDGRPGESIPNPHFAADGIALPNDPVALRNGRPSGLNSTCNMVPVCCNAGKTGLPVATSHTITSPSFSPVEPEWLP